MGLGANGDSVSCLVGIAGEMVGVSIMAGWDGRAAWLLVVSLCATSRVDSARPFSNAKKIFDHKLLTRTSTVVGVWYEYELVGSTLIANR